MFKYLKPTPSSGICIHMHALLKYINANVKSHLLAGLSVLLGLHCCGCNKHPIKSINKNITLTLRCVITVHDETLWTRNRNLVIRKINGNRYYHVIGNPLEFHSKKLTATPIPFKFLDDLMYDTFLFLKTHGEDVRAREEEDKAEWERFLEDAKDGKIDSEAFQQYDPDKPIQWTLTFNYGEIETVPATDQWLEEKRTKNELEYTIDSGDRSDLPQAFRELLKRYEDLFKDVSEMDTMDSNNKNKSKEVPQLIIQN